MATVASFCSRFRQLKHSPTLRLSLPGVLVLIACWLGIFSSVDHQSIFENGYAFMQSLGREALEERPWSALGVLHIQPPGLSVLHAIDLAVTPESHALLIGLYLLVAIGSLVMIVDALLLLGCPSRVSKFGGIVFACLPSTAIYALWPYNTTPTAFFVMAMVWGVIRMKVSPLSGTLVSSVACLLLFLTRSTFALPFVIAWLAFLLLLTVVRSSSSTTLSRSAIGLCLIIALTIQVHYFFSFRVATLTSWTGENFAKALTQSGQLEIAGATFDKFPAGSCEDSLLRSLESGSAPIWNPTGFRALPGCRDLPQLNPRGVPEWDSDRNFNWSERLVASRKWTTVMNQVILDNPIQLLRMALLGPSGPGNSGLDLYLGPSEDYFLVVETARTHPLRIPGGVLSLVFAPGMIVLGLTGLVFRPWGRGTFDFGFFSVAAVSFVVLYHVLANNLVEYGEGMRFQVEVAPLLVIFGIGSLGNAVSRR